jgi:hypothetical protein
LLDVSTEDENESEDASESEDDEETGSFTRKTDLNRHLAVGSKSDRSFVVKGGAVGVFKHTNDDRLEFVAAIGDLSKPSGETIAPSKVCVSGIIVFALFTKRSILFSKKKPYLLTGNVARRRCVYGLTG